MITLARYAAVAIAFALMWWALGAFFSLEANPLRWGEGSRVFYVIGVGFLLIIYWLDADLWE